MASLMVGVVNGWDNVVDSNDGKSFLGSFALTPVEQFTLLINGIYGAEQADRGDSKRGVADIVATIKPVENFAIILNYDYGNESDLGVGGDAEWNAFAGILSFDVPDALVVPIGFALPRRVLRRLGRHASPDARAARASATTRTPGRSPARSRWCSPRA